MGVERARVGSRGAHQRPQARPCGPRQRAQTLPDQPAVLPHQRHQVGHGGQRDQLEIVLDARSPERLCDLVSNAGAAEVRAGVPADARMHDLAVGQAAVRPWGVVVAHHHVEPGLARGGDLVNGSDRAVDGEQQAGAAIGQPANRPERQPVPVRQPVRQVPPHVGIAGPQRAHHDRGRAHSVDVVIAVHDDPAAASDVPVDQAHRSIDPGERAGLMRLLRIEKRPGRCGIANAAADEYLREDVTDAELPAQGQGRGQVVGRDLQPRNGRSQLPDGAERDLRMDERISGYGLDRLSAQEGCLGHAGQRMERPRRNGPISARFQPNSARFRSIGGVRS